MKRRTLLVAGSAAALLATGGAGLAAAWSAGPAAAPAAAPPATAAVTRGDLAQTERVTGTLGFAGARTVGSTVDGTVTALPAENSVVQPGEALYAVDAEPVTLLGGDIPLWRELATGVADGPDVRQLEQALVTLGVGDRLRVDEHFSSATATTVAELQERLRVAETSRVGPEQFVVLPGAVRVGAHQAAVGDRVGPGAPLYAATSTERIVSANVPAARAAGVELAGVAAAVTLPDGSRVDATISGVGAATADGEGGTVVPLTLTLADPAAAGDAVGAPVSVDLTARVVRDVLTVPVTALLALAEGGYAVQVPTGTGTRLVAVQVGAYAGGRVEISGSGIAAGTEVVVPS